MWRRAWIIPAFVTAFLSVCYALWLGNGCGAFTPFISDLGLVGSMRVVFAGGLLITYVMLSISAVDLWLLRLALADALALSRRGYCCFVVLSTLHAGGGLVIAFGLGLLGFFPWSEQLGLHLLCAMPTLAGGPYWAIINAVSSSLVAWRLPNEAREARAWPKVAMSAALAGLAFVAGHAMAVAMILELRKSGALYGSLREVRADFHSYCSAGSRRMSTWSVTAVAAAEWLTIYAVLCNLLCCKVDIDLYLAVARSARAATVHDATSA